jgi:hypothetical protein
VIRTALKSTVAAAAIAGAAVMSVPAAAHADVSGGNNVIVIVGGDVGCSAIAIYGVADNACIRH